MFVIGSVPKRLEKFFGNIEGLLEKRQVRHFRALVLAFAVAHGRRNISQMNRVLPDRDQRQRRQDFLVQSPWDGAPILRTQAWNVLRSVKPRRGELLEMIIDGSHAPKRGKTMEGAHRYFDPVTKDYQSGHAFVLCTLRFRGVSIPWAVRPWLTRKFCRSERGRELGLKFRTSNQIAAEIIRELPADIAELCSVRVLFDSGFLNEEVVGACKERGFHFISVAKSNRVLFPTICPKKRKVSSYGRGVLRAEGRTIRVPAARGTAKCRVAERCGHMRGIGHVKAVFSERLSDRSFVVLVTDDVSLSAREVVCGYKSRWAIEVLLKNLKQCLGLGHYQTTRYEGFTHHLHLCLISFVLLTTLGLDGSARKRRRDAAIEIDSIPTLQDKVRILIAKDHMRRLQRSKSPQHILARLRELLVAA
jgi:SRSO17 transposase